MKKAVFFDFFGVISCEISPIWFRRHFDDAMADQIKQDIVSLADVGMISEEETYQRISDRTGIPPEQVRTEWEELVEINERLVSFIQKVKERYPIYLLSNAIDPFLIRIIEKHQLYSLFDKIFISSLMGIAKPGKEFFEYVLSDLDLNAEDVVMIDDNIANIVGARLAGIDGILFVNNEQFKQAFDTFYASGDLTI
jgi:putative hydrolase of the HAD superfamily